jgi:exopolysaccharide biosynthesis polyprenyl glycosylphosphotransferase
MQAAQSGTAVGIAPARTEAAALPHLPAAKGNAAAASPLIRRFCSPSMRIADLLALSAALMLTFFSATIVGEQSLHNFLSMRVSMSTLGLEIGMLVIWRAVFWGTGMYQPRLNRRASTFLWRVPMTVALCTALLAPVLYLSHHVVQDALCSGFVFWFTGTTLLFATRSAYYTVDEHVRPMFLPRRNLVIVGTGARARMMTAALITHPNVKYQFVGFVDSDPQPECERVGPVLGGINDLEAILMRQPIDEVLITLPLKSCFADVQQVVSICGRAGVQTQYSLDLFTTDIAKAQTIDETTNSRVMEMVHIDHRLYLKSALDRVASFFGLLLLSPVLLCIAAAIKLTSKGPILFKQERFGKNKRRFFIYKFRSMCTGAEERMKEVEVHNEFGGPMFKMRNDPRVTKVGAFLRRTSLDELPQLFNVLMGEMSLVGPRPLSSRDVALFSEPWLMRRFSVCPGITGLWQVSGRSSTDFERMIQLDLNYIDTWSLVQDVRILAKTFSAVTKGSGAF